MQENTLGERLKTLRKMHKVSQEDLVESVGVTRQTLSKWEKNQSIPDAMMIKRLADLFGISVDELLDFSEGEKTNVKTAKEHYVFGEIVVGPAGHIQLPKEALKLFDIKTDDEMIVLGDVERGLELVPSDALWKGRLLKNGRSEEV